MPDTLLWVAPSGDAYTLPAMPGVQGRFMPRVAWASKPNALVGGNRLVSTRHGARDLVVPVWISGMDETDLRAWTELWVDVLDPTAGEGILRSIRPDGTTRELKCIYTGGLEGDEAMEAMGVTPWASEDFLVAALGFQASEPYWYDPDTQGAYFETGDPPPWFPWPPIVVGSSNITQEQRVINPGRVEAWPVWIVQGPFTRVVITSVARQQSLIVDAELLVGQSITIDTRVKTARDAGGDNRYRDVARDATSVMWPLLPNVNDLLIDLQGSVPGQSSVTLLYQARYLMP